LLQEYNLDVRKPHSNPGGIMDGVCEATVRILGQEGEGGLVCRGIIVKFYPEPEAVPYADPHFGQEYIVDVPATIRDEMLYAFHSRTLAVRFEQLIGFIPAAEQIPDIIRAQLDRFEYPNSRGPQSA
jgi:hypothetical protein